MRMLRVFSMAGVLVGGSALLGQSITSGSLSGNLVKVRGGGPVGLGTVTLRNPETGWTRSQRASDQGTFAFRLVPVGTYELLAMAPGMLGKRLRGISVRLGAARDFRIAMEETVASAVVEVVGASSEIDVVQTSPATRFFPETLDTLPMESRHLNGLLALIPGSATLANGEISVHGARSSQNQFLLDGMTVTSSYNGIPLGATGISLLATLGTAQEIQVLNQPFDVQFGEAVGTLVNALSRSGTNQVQGTALFQVRPSAWLSRRLPVEYDPLGYKNRAVNLESRRSTQVAAFSQSGPLVKDRLHYLVGFEQSTIRDEIRPVPFVLPSWGYSVEDLEDWNRTLGDRLRVGVGPRTWSQDMTQAWGSAFRRTATYLKFDGRVGESHTLALRISLSAYGWNPSTRDSTSGVSRAATTHTSNQLTLLEWKSLVGDSVIHEARIQWIRSGFRTEALAQDALGLQIAKTQTGSNGSTPQNFRERMLQLTDVWSVGRGAWQYKAGLDLKFTRVHDDYVPGKAGEFFFQTYRTAVAWVQGDGAVPGTLRYWQGYRMGGDTDRLEGGLHAAYLQASRRDAFLKGLDLQAGLRFSRQTWSAASHANPALGGLDSPSGAQSLDPRFSFLWRLPGSGGWTLRGGLGQFSAPNLGVLGLMSRTWNGEVAGLLEVVGTNADPRFRNGVFSPSARLQDNRLKPLATEDLRTLLREEGGQVLNLWDPEERLAQTWKAVVSMEGGAPEKVAWKFEYGQARTRNLANWVNINLAQCDLLGQPIPGAYYADGYPTLVNRFSIEPAHRPGRARVRGRLLDFGKAGDVYLATRNGRASSEYLVLVARREPPRGFGGQASLTLSRSRDHNTNEHSQLIYDNAQPRNPANPGADWASSDYERPVSLRLRAHFTSASGFMVVLNGNLESALPLTPLDNWDLNGDGNFNDPSPGLGGRNAWRRGTQSRIDLLVSQTWKGPRKGSWIKLEAEVVNLQNRSQALFLNPYATSQGTPIPDFGKTTDPDPIPRSLKVALRLGW